MVVAGLTPLPVGFPQKLQGSAMTKETKVPFRNILYFGNAHTEQTATLRLCSLFFSNLQLCCPFISAASAAD